MINWQSRAGVARRATPVALLSAVRLAVALFAVALFAVALAACGRGAAPGPDSDVPDPDAAASGPSDAAPEPELLYVASQAGAAVSVIDMNAREVVATIDLTALSFTSTSRPHDTAVEPDGSHWYVSLIGDNQVLKFDRDNNLVGQLEFERPGILAMESGGDRLFVGRSMAAVNPPQRIGVIERGDMSIEELDVFFARPHAIAVHGPSGQVYSASLAENRIAVVDPTEDGLELVDVDGDLHTLVQFAISPDGNTLVAGGEMSGEILVFDLADPMAPVQTQSIGVGGAPWHPVYSPDGAFVHFPMRLADSVVVIDTSTWEVAGRIAGSGLSEPHGSAISADGSTLWVSGRNTNGGYAPRELAEGEQPPGTVVAIDTATRSIVAVIEVPPYAAGIATRPHR